MEDFITVCFSREETVDLVEVLSEVTEAPAVQVNDDLFVERIAELTENGCEVFPRGVQVTISGIPRKMVKKLEALTEEFRGLLETVA